jgi:outer membrane protein assembly factor BamB
MNSDPPSVTVSSVLLGCVALFGAGCPNRMAQLVGDGGLDGSVGCGLRNGDAGICTNDSQCPDNSYCDFTVTQCPQGGDPSISTINPGSCLPACPYTSVPDISPGAPCHINEDCAPFETCTEETTCTVELPCDAGICLSNHAPVPPPCPGPGCRDIQVPHTPGEVCVCDDNACPKPFDAGVGDAGPDAGPDAGAPDAGLPPDGTPCELWWAPCVTDAFYRAGICFSATADAEQPGDLRWTYPSTGCSYGWNAIDDDGNLYVVQYDTIISLDACGRLRWQLADAGTSIGFLSASLIFDQVVVTTSDSLNIAAYSKEDGTALWRFDAEQLDGCDGGIDCRASVAVPAIANDGAIYTAVNWGTFDGSVTRVSSQLVRLAMDGGIIWTRDLPPSSYGWGGVVADLSGDVWISNQYSPGGIEMFAPDGHLGLQTDAGSVWVIGDGYAIGTMAYPLDGGAAMSPPNLLGGDCQWGLPTLVDAVGAIYSFECNGEVARALIGEQASSWNTQPWPTGVAMTDATLGDSNQLFVLMLNQDQGITDLTADGGTIAAYDTMTGSLLWTTTYPLEASWCADSLMLAPTATLIANDGDGIHAFYAGKTKPSANAFWSWEGGDNTNRSSPPPTAGQ